MKIPINESYEDFNHKNIVLNELNQNLIAQILFKASYIYQPQIL